MNKLQVARAILQRGSLYIHVCPLHNSFDVQLPLRCMQNRHVVLNVGYDMAKPIPDLQLNEKGMSGTLSFAGTPFFCVVPWECVVALGDERGLGVSFDEEMVPTKEAPLAEVVDLAAYRAKKAARQ